MPKSFQWITLLLIESIYFASIKVKGPHTLVWIIPSNSIRPLESMSKFQFHRTSGKHGKHVQIPIPSDLWEACPKSNHRTSGKHVQISNPLDLWEARPNFKPLDHWEARPNFKSIGPLGSTSKLQTIGPLGSTSKFQSIGPLGSTSKLQSIEPLGSTSKFQIHRTFGKHVQIPIPSDLWEAHPKSNHRTSGKYVQTSNHWTSGKHV